ncbi:MAG TPA: GDP-mannose 4,6-dehydratase, partial [Candidatus Paceibacterota bacterium]
MAKRAIITGITGQDGSYLAELLLGKGYRVFGLQRRASLPNTERIDHLYGKKGFEMMYADLSDSSNMLRVMKKIEPDEFYNLGAQSHVAVSFDVPEFTLNVNALGTLRILETIRNLGLPVRFYQASSSEMFGKALQTPQKETTPFNPQSPYGLSKVCAFYLTKLYRTGYGVFAANG